MFTGLVNEIGTLVGMRPVGGILRLTIKAPEVAGRTKVGDSVAVAGICLTVTATRKGHFTVEAAAETRRLTTLGSWRVGRHVHLEPALRLGDALDGHIVQGHVDGVGVVKSLRPVQGGHRLDVSYPLALGRFLTPKGSVAIDGVSLTVDEGPFTGTFAVNLIPLTMRRTNFGSLRSGDKLNLEMDVLVKAIRQGGQNPLAATQKNTRQSVEPVRGISLERILNAGFGRKTNRGSS